MFETAPLLSKIDAFPKGGRAYWIKANDGVRLRVASWNSDSQQNGTVFLFAGISSFIERNIHTIADLESRGFASFVIDWRGHGMSDRLIENPNTIHIEDFADYQKDVEAMIEAATKLCLPKPWYILGKSMGAAIGLRSIIDGIPVICSVFTAPMWGVEMHWATRLAAWPLSSLSHNLGFGHLYVPGYDDHPTVLTTNFSANNFTHDKVLYEGLQKVAKKFPDAHTGGPSMSWLYAALRECRSLQKLPCPSMAGLVYFGENDKTVNIEATKAVVSRWTNARYCFIENAKHDLLSEVPEIRFPLVDEICSFFKDSS